MKHQISTNMYTVFDSFIKYVFYITYVTYFSQVCNRQGKNL